MSTPELVLDVHRLVEVARLASIETAELSARRVVDVEVETGFEIEPNYELTINLRDDFEGFRVMLSTEIVLPIGTIGCGVYAEYVLEGARIGTESTEALGEFINGVALMHVFPFVRQTISDLATRVFGTALLMPIIKRGELGFTIELNPDSALASQSPELRSQ